MSNENAAIQLDVNATGAVAAINDVKTALAGVGAEATKTGAALEGVNADGAEKVSAKVRSMRDQLQRTTDGVVALARGFDEVAVAEQKISRKGIPLADVSGQLAALREARTELTAVQQKEAVLASEALKVAQAFKAQEAEAAAAATQIRVYENAVRSAKLEMLSLGKSASEKAQIRGDLFGIDPTVVAKQVSSLKEIEASQLAAATAAQALAAKGGAAMNTLHGSTKAYSAALRQVPAQFTDIIVSLQGGQAPLTVLLQQGGQLKDVFGGVGAAAKALGSYVLGLINPFTIAAAAAGTLALAYIKGAAESEAFNKALIMTGNYAGTTALQMSQMSKAISGATGGTIGAAAEALTALAASGDVSAAQFTRLGTAVTQWAKATGMSVGDVAKQFSKLQDEPLKATLALNDSQHYLTRTVYDQIKALEDQGRMLEAGVVAQNAWSDAINQRAPLLVENLGLIEKTWRALGSAAKWAWDGMLGIGRQVDESEILRKSIAAEEAFLRSKFGKVPDDDAGLNAMRAKLAIQEKGAGYEAQSAAYQREEAKATEAKAAWAKESDKYLSKQVQMQREIAKAQSLYSQQKPEDQNPAKYAETIAGIQKKYAEAPKHIKAASDAYDTLAATIERSAAASEDYLNTQQKSAASAKFEREQLDAIDKALRQKNISLDQAVELENRLHDATLRAIEVEQRQGASKASQEAIKFMQAENKAYEDHAKVLRTSEKAIEDYADSAKLMADDLVFETKLIGLNTAERERAIEQRKIQLELDKEIRRINDTAGLTFEEKESQKAVAMQAAVSKSSTAAARSSLNEWAKTADSIRDSLVDAFDSAILAGKDLFTSLRDAAVKLFDGLVLRPILQGVLQPVAAALTGSLIGTAANAATGASATSGLLSSVTGIGAAAGQGSISSLLGSSGMGALDIMGFDPTTLAIGAAILVLSQMGGKFISATDSGRARVDYNSAGVGGSAYSTTGDATQIAAATANTNALAKTYFDTASALGVKAMQAAFEVGTNTGREGAAPQTVLGVNIGKASYSSGEIASTDAAGLQLAASRAVLTALLASELPSYLSGVFDDITVSTATQDQITTALTSAGALATFNKELQALPFSNLADLSYSATQSLIRFSGGLDTLKTNLGTYYSNFYTAEEQRAQTIANINKATAGSGLDAATATRESFRKIVEAQDLTTESGRTTYAALLSVSGAMAGLLTPAADTAKALADTAKAAADAATALAKTNQGWKDQLDVLTGAETDRSIALRDAGDDSTRALMNQVYAQQDLKAATEAAASAAQTAASAFGSLMSGLASTQSSLQNQLLTLQGNTAQVRLNEIAAATKGLSPADTAAYTAGYDANAALTKQISDLQAAQQAQAAAAQAASQASAAVVSQRTGLERQLLQAQGDTTALRALDLAAIDPANQALQQNIWALEDQAKADQAAAAAAQSAASAAQALTSAWQSVTDSIFDEVARIRGLLGGGSTQSYAQAQAQFAITTAQATSGNQDAAKLLPQLSQTLLTLAEANATSLYELQIIRAQTAGSLSNTGNTLAGKFGLTIPSFDVGTNYVPADTLAYVHQGEAIVPRAYNQQSDNGALIAEVQALRKSNEVMQATLARIEETSRKTSTVLTRVTQNGEAMQTTAA